MGGLLPRLHVCVPDKRGLVEQFITIGRDFHKTTVFKTECVRPS